MIYRISEFADKCGVNKETIRYYERKNLLQEPHRTEAGYRIYSYEKKLHSCPIIETLT